MKKSILFVFSAIIGVCMNSEAQLTTTQVIDSVDSPSKYYFKHFSDGIVFLKNGSEANVQLNYQMQEQAIMYIDTAGKRLLLSNVEDVDSVAIDGFVYIPVNGKFYEKLTNGANQLLLSMYGKAKPQSSTLVVTDVKTVSKDMESGDVSGTYINRIQKWNSILGFVNNFWLKDSNNKLIRLKGIKQVVSAYPEKKEAILDYENKRKTDFNNVESVARLIQFCNGGL